MTAHAGGFTCAQVDEGAQHLAAAVSRLREELRARRILLEALAAIPDITISKWACDPGGHWNPVREALRASRAAQGFDVDAADPETAFDERGWLVQRASLPPLALVEDRTPEQLAADGDLEPEPV